MISMRGVRFGYGDGGVELRVDGLEVGEGERVAVVGPSGSGKTTLLGLMGGVLVPDEGVVSVDGVEVSGMRDGARRRFRAARVGFVFQEFELLEYLSVGENIVLPYRLGDGGRLDDAARERGAGLAERVGLGEKLGRSVGTLSRGERQRVAICRAMVREPGVILADEPTSSLDEGSSGAVMDLMMGLIEERGATLVMLTHDRGVLGRFDRVVDVRGLCGQGVAG